jgi:hypothetical protein
MEMVSTRAMDLTAFVRSRILSGIGVSSFCFEEQKELTPIPILSKNKKN